MVHLIEELEKFNYKHLLTYVNTIKMYTNFNFRTLFSSLKKPSFRFLFQYLGLYLGIYLGTSGILSRHPLVYIWVYLGFIMDYSWRLVKITCVSVYVHLYHIIVMLSHIFPNILPIRLTTNTHWNTRQMIVTMRSIMWRARNNRQYTKARLLAIHAVTWKISWQRQLMIIWWSWY